MGKVDLSPYPYENEWHAPGHLTLSVKRSLPHYRANTGTYIHRVKYAAHHWWGIKFAHTIIGFWCGASGNSNRGTLLPHGTEGVYCATCEGRAIGAGVNPPITIRENLVKFQPRI